MIVSQCKKCTMHFLGS